MLFDNKMKKDFDDAKNLLGYNDFQLAEFLEMTVDELKSLEDYPSHFIKQKELEPTLAKKLEIIEELLRPIRTFKWHRMTTEDIMKTYNEIHKVNGSSMTLKELIKKDFKYGSKEQQHISKTVQDKCLHYFTHYEIGEGMELLKKLNVDICKLFLKEKVAVKETWVYQEHGDHTILEAKSYKNKNWEPIPKYSTSISDAWKLVDILASKGVQIRLSNKAMGNKYWWCYLSAEPESDRPDVCSQGNSAPEAICLAILDYCKKTNN